MMDIDFTKLTKQQLRVFEQIAVNNDAGHSQKVLDNLEQHGYITSELQYLSGFPPVRVCRYSVPIAVHMQWCAWCATLPVGGNDSATNLG